LRILFVSNLYPPVIRGGYEQLCHEVALELVARGHELSVLTSRGGSRARGDGFPEDGIAVHRRLHLEVEGGVLSTTVRWLRDRVRLERENVACIRDVLASFTPDAVMVWGMWNVPRSVPATLETLCPERLIYYVCDYWPALPSAYLQHWLAPSHRRITRLAKQILGYPFVRQLRREHRPAVRLERTYCVSRATRDLLVGMGVPLRHAGIIYGNARIEQFSNARPGFDRDVNGCDLRLLYSGRLSPEKGVATAIRAIAHLPEALRPRVHLDVVGAGAPAYERHLRALVDEYGLMDRVTLCGSVARQELPAILARHDVLIFPSQWPEPFARTVLEAMAAGLAIVGSTTGGTSEVLVDDRTGLTFTAGDSVGLARQIARMADEPSMRARLAEAGRCFVAEHFTFTQTVDGLESALRAVPGTSPRACQLGNLIHHSSPVPIAPGDVSK
jgi:glycosyltransferase involved in cell wall biosynthesis